MNVLAVCNLGQNRSRTLAELLSRFHQTRYKGLFMNKVSSLDLEWADLVIVMSDEQRTEISKRFPKEYLKSRILVLEVPDVYSYNQPELVSKLRVSLSVEPFSELFPSFVS